MSRDFDEFYLDYLKKCDRAEPDIGIMLMVEPEKLGLTEDFIEHWIGRKCPGCGTPLERRKYVIGHQLAEHIVEVEEET